LNESAFNFNTEYICEINGVITNLVNDHSISLGGTLTGQLSGLIPGLTETNALNDSYIQYYDISGELFNTDFGEDTEKTHVEYIKPANILGRKILSDKNPLMG
jgi:hypothetical protein